jgi:hypothetical protein
MIGIFFLQMKDLRNKVVKLLVQQEKEKRKQSVAELKCEYK